MNIDFIFTNVSLVIAAIIDLMLKVVPVKGGRVHIGKLVWQN